MPLNRPLSQVDPSVRMLSAIAQGLGGHAGSTGRSVNIAEGAITVVTPTENPVAVATELLNQLVATSYL